jgi:hypothetical protein
VSAHLSGFDVDQPLYPLLSMTRAEAVKVVAFGMHRKPRRVIEDIRGGFVILGGMVGFLIVVAAVLVGLVWFGMTHPW